MTTDYKKAMEEWLTLAEAAEVIGINPKTLHKRIRCMTVKATKRGHGWFIHKDEVELQVKIQTEMAAQDLRYKEARSKH